MLVGLRLRFSGAPTNAVPLKWIGRRLPYPTGPDDYSSKQCRRYFGPRRNTGGPFIRNAAGTASVGPTFSRIRFLFAVDDIRRRFESHSLSRSVSEYILHCCEIKRACYFALNFYSGLFILIGGKEKKNDRFQIARENLARFSGKMKQKVKFFTIVSAYFTVIVSA